MIYNTIMQQVKRIPNKNAIIDNGEKITYRELGKKVHMIENILGDLLLKGEPIGICLYNSIEFLSCLCAAEEQNHPALLLSIGFHKNEIIYHLGNSHTRYVVCFEDMTSIFEEIGGVLSKRYETLYFYKFPIELDLTKYEKDDFICQLTSGSQGESKGVIRTKQQIFQQINETVEITGLGETDIFLTVPPLSHSYGLIAGGLLPLCYGATLVLTRQFTVVGTIKAIKKYNVTVAFLVPFMYELIMNTNYKEIPDLSSLRMCFSAGAILSERVLNGFYKMFGLYINSDYGSTETGVMCYNMDPEKNVQSVGKSVGERLIRIVDEERNVLGTHTLGKIETKSRCNLRCYLYPERKNNNIQDGWIALGDVGYIDDDGYVYVHGRETNFINVGGEKVDPSEVEKVINEISGVKEVVVIGKKSKTYGEIVKAIIVKEGELSKSHIAKYCLDKIATYKIPKIIEFVENIPKSNTGKILKKYLIDYERSVE